MHELFWINSYIAFGNCDPILVFPTKGKRKACSEINNKNISSNLVNMLHWVRTTQVNEMVRQLSVPFFLQRSCSDGKLCATLHQWQRSHVSIRVLLFLAYWPRAIALITRILYCSWTPDAIVFNSWQQYGTPSYWMQTFFCESSGSLFHPIAINSTYSPKLAASAITWQDHEISFLRVKVRSTLPISS
jgi:hypothetical protein